MKKITILGLSVLFAACSMNNELSDVGTDQASLSESLENLANGYELALKGYTIEDVTMEKMKKHRQQQRKPRHLPG